MKQKKKDRLQLISEMKHNLEMMYNSVYNLQEKTLSDKNTDNEIFILKSHMLSFGVTIERFINVG